MNPIKKINEILNSIGINSYFQPPENIRITYPCVVYSPQPPYVRSADNISYIRRPVFTMVYISKKYDQYIIDKISSAFMCITETGTYKSDGLYHTQFEITM